MKTVKLNESQLRKLVCEMSEPRSVFKVAREVFDKFFEIVKREGYTADQLNDKEFFMSIQDQAFDEVAPPEFGSRADLNRAHKASFDDELVRRKKMFGLE